MVRKEHCRLCEFKRLRHWTRGSHKLCIMRYYNAMINTRTVLSKQEYRVVGSRGLCAMTNKKNGERALRSPEDTVGTGS